MLVSSAELLHEMGLSLLEGLLGSPDLFVMQVEMDIYTLAKKVWCVESEGPPPGCTRSQRCHTACSSRLVLGEGPKGCTLII